MLKTIKKLATSVALAGTIIYGAIIAPEMHNHYLRWEVGESVVQVLHVTQNGGGTGFAIQGKSGKQYIMTNRHVCEVKDASGTVRIKVNEKQSYLRKVVYQDSVHDLCLVESVPGLSALTIGSNLDKGDYLYVVGHPGLRQLTTSTGEYIGNKIIEMIYDVEKKSDCPGKIVDLPPIYQIILGRQFLCTREYDALSTSAVIYGGNSGSPVVNKWGNLIGVAFAGSVEQERDNYVVPLSYVKDVLNKF